MELSNANFYAYQPVSLPAEIDHEKAAKANATETPFVQGEGDSNAIDPNDVNQDGYGSCAVLSTIKSIAAQNPDVLKNMIRDNGDGTYTVTFKEYDNGFFGIGSGWDKKEVTVAGPFDGKAADIGDMGKDGQGEVWPAIIEKAYAQYADGGYKTYDDGESPADVQEAILGRDSRTESPSEYDSGELSDKLKNGEAVVAWTAGSEGWNDEQKKLAADYGAVGGHAYRVEDVYTDADGNTRIKLDNPWGHSDVDMPYSDYQKLYHEVNSTPTK